MRKKRIGIMTTGGDCSGLNSVINRVIRGATLRGWDVIGIKDGTDGLISAPLNTVHLTEKDLPIEDARLAGSILGNGHANALNFETALVRGQTDSFCSTLRKSLRDLKLDALILIGGNGSTSLAWANRDIYRDVQLVCIPKTIDMDMPLTARTIGFDTAVQQLTSFCDQLILTARSHHRWFVVQAMGRDCGNLALNAGVATGASAILIPEIKFNIDDLLAHIKNAPTDYGIIMVSEGITLRGHSGKPADMIARKLTAAGISNRTAFPEHTQRVGDTTACDRILAARFADCALNAIENKETYVITILTADNVCKTVPLDTFIRSGECIKDPKIDGLMTANAYVEPDDPLLSVAQDMGIYIGDYK